MLVLSRQKDETIIIGDDVEVTVVDIRGDKVRLGVSAPKSMSVHRREVYDAIRREKRNVENQLYCLCPPTKVELDPATRKCLACGKPASA